MRTPVFRSVNATLKISAGSKPWHETYYTIATLEKLVGLPDKSLQFSASQPGPLPGTHCKQRILSVAPQSSCLEHHCSTLLNAC